MVIWLMTMGSLRYAKNWLTKERSAQEMKPIVHIRNVHTGSVESSVVGTVSRTCSTGDTSSSSAAARPGGRSISICPSLSPKWFC
jgi:hypothetical protein